uniref:Keratin associated protein 20-4 n=1 Tax=Mandrillus leucophaeus TaxID=9568 RepID=A0A2K5Z0G9_MANLE
MSYYSHLSGDLGCGCGYGKCRHGCHPSYSAR